LAIALGDFPVANSSKIRRTTFLTPEHNVRKIAKALEEQPGTRNTELAKRFGVDVHAILLTRRAMPIVFDNDLYLVFPTGNGTVITTQNVWMQ
jgi:hypothetical protein